jgi:Fe-S-cluster containining protein
MTFDSDEVEVLPAVARKRALAETREILRQASATFAKWSCPSTAECCQLKTTQRPPWLWPTEWALLLEFLRRKQRPLPPAREDGGCPFLDEAGARCTVYEVRPFGCRTYFCHRVKGPSRQPTLETDALLSQLAAANLELQSESAPLPLPQWHAAAAAD